MNASTSEDVVVSGLLVGVLLYWPLTGVFVPDVAALDKPGHRVLDHGESVLPEVPDCQPGVLHLFDLVGALLGVVALESDGGATVLVTAFDGTDVVEVAS